MKVGDLVKWKDGSGVSTLSAVSDDEAFVNVERDKSDGTWWPSKCFEVVTPAEPTYSYVVIDGPIGPQRFHLVPGEELAIRFEVKWRGAETT